MFEFIKSHMQSPETLKDHDLEPTFIDLKNKVMQVAAGGRETIGGHLERRLYHVQSCILARHKRYHIEVEAQFPPEKLFNLLKLRGDSVRPRSIGS
jgi:hypothetical protein